jgi:nitroreductase
MKGILKYLFYVFRLEVNCVYDYVKFKRFYSSEKQKFKTEKNIKSWVLQDKHRIEKALSLPKPKPLFGRQVILRLIENLNELESRFGKGEVYFFGVGAINVYLDYHKNLGLALFPDMLEAIKSLNTGDFHHPATKKVGVDSLAIGMSIDNSIKYFDEFSNLRRSCRNFTGELISELLAKSIIKQAIRAPSVCNRQHWRVDFFSGVLKDKILSLQNGNAGFTNNIPHIAVVSSDISAFYNADERNQMYTDGGIFGMNLIYAFQAHGLSSCALNWSASAFTELKLNKLKLIPNTNQVIFLVAFGYGSPMAKIAKSPRLSLENFYKWHL